MAEENKIYTRIQHKRDTTERWEQSTTPLLDGELAYDKTNKNIKIGDGSSNWNELEYLIPEVTNIIDENSTDNQVPSAKTIHNLTLKNLNYKGSTGNFMSFKYSYSSHSLGDVYNVQENGLFDCYKNEYTLDITHKVRPVTVTFEDGMYYINVQKSNILSYLNNDFYLNSQEDIILTFDNGLSVVCNYLNTNNEGSDVNFVSSNSELETIIQLFDCRAKSINCTYYLKVNAGDNIVWVGEHWVKLAAPIIVDSNISRDSKNPVASAGIFNHTIDNLKYIGNSNNLNIPEKSFARYIGSDIYDYDLYFDLTISEDIFKYYFTLKDGDYNYIECNYDSTNPEIQKLVDRFVDNINFDSIEINGKTYYGGTDILVSAENTLKIIHNSNSHYSTFYNNIKNITFVTNYINNIDSHGSSEVISSILKCGGTIIRDIITLTYLPPENHIINYKINDINDYINNMEAVVSTFEESLYVPTVKAVKNYVEPIISNSFKFNLKNTKFDNEYSSVGMQIVNGNVNGYIEDNYISVSPTINNLEATIDCSEITDFILLEAIKHIKSVYLSYYFNDGEEILIAEKTLTASFDETTNSIRFTLPSNFDSTLGIDTIFSYNLSYNFDEPTVCIIITNDYNYATIYYPIIGDMQTELDVLSNKIDSLETEVELTYVKKSEILKKGYLTIGTSENYQSTDVDYFVNIADATLILQQAIDDAGVKKQIVKILPGTYTVKTTLSIGNNTIVEGSGNESVIIIDDSDGGYQDAAIQLKQGSKLKDITIDINELNTNYKTIDMVGNNVTIENCNFGAPSAQWYDAITVSSLSTICNCNITGVINIVSRSNVHIENNNIDSSINLFNSEKIYISGNTITNPSSNDEVTESVYIDTETNHCIIQNNIMDLNITNNGTINLINNNIISDSIDGITYSDI